MDLLRNLGSAAASSLLHKAGISIPYTLGERVTEYDGKSVWKLYDAIKKDDSSPVSVFHFDHTSANNIQPLFPTNALKKLRTTRHPDILKYIDLVEQGGSIWIMTERVRPLRGALFSWGNEDGTGGKGKRKNKSKEEWTIWGLQRIAVALTFINNACASTHGNLTIDSIFLSPSGEWRLGGFELLSSTKDEKPVLFSHGQQYPHPQDISPPEVKKEGYKALQDLLPGVADAYALAILINTVFNLTTTPPATTQPPHAPLPASARGNIPASIFPLAKKLFNPNPKIRMTSQAFLEIGMGERAGVDGVSGRFFADNHLVAVCSKLESFPLASDGEKAEFIRALKESASSFPPEFSINRIIPALFSSLEHGGASAAIVLPLIFELAKLAERDSTTSEPSSHRAFSLEPAEYTARIIRPMVKLFPKPDRGTRMALLESLPEYESKLDARTVQDGIWPHLQTGFADTVPIIREATIRAVSLVASKLSSRVMNNDLLRHLAKAQSDPEPSIRTNTCILIARLAPTLSDNTKKKVLVPAFSKALKDSFVHARVAGVAGLTACVDCFDMEDAATRLLGVIGGGLVDKEKIVRDQAFKCLDVYRAKLEAYAATLPETVIPPESASTGPNGVAYNAAPADSGVYVASATGAAGAIAGWAFSSISSRLVTGDLATKMTPGTPLSPNSAASTPATSPLPVGMKPAAAASSIVAAAERRTAERHASSAARTAKGKGMALGSKAGAKGSMSNGQAALMAELEKEMKSEEVEVADAWDDDDPYAEEAAKDNVAGGDLMDVNADQDDWTAFESAPAVLAPADAASSAWGATLQSPASAVVSDNPWQESTDDLESAFTKEPAYPSLSTQTTLQPKSLSSTSRIVTTAAVSSGRSTPSGGMSAVPSTWQSPVTSPKINDDWGGFGTGEMVSVDEARAGRAASPPASMAGMSKEEKAAEMARRREERKARIAQLKEQKKGGV